MAIPFMNCPKCGNPVEKDAKFCSKCYARIEPPNLLRRLISLFQNLSKPGPMILKTEKTAKITTVDKDGNRREYRSVDEVPLGMRSQMEKLQAGVEKMNPLSAEMLAQARDQPGMIIQKSFSVYKFKDAAGQEHVYHSLDELPPKIQEALRRIEGVPGPVSWRDKSVQVRAGLVPRYLWTSASIDVYLDGECVFRTGGKIQSIGSHAAAFRIGGSEHQMEVSWGRSRNFRFPYQLKIDGNPVMESQVPVENQGLMMIPALLIVAVLFSFVAGLYWILKFALQFISGN